MSSVYAGDIHRWDLDGVKLTHFDGNVHPIPVLNAVSQWLAESNVEPSRIIIDYVFNSELGQYEYLATVEWASMFSV